MKLIKSNTKWQLKYLLCIILGITNSMADFCNEPPDVDNKPPYPEISESYFARTEIIDHMVPNHYPAFEMTVEEVYDGPNQRVLLSQKSKNDILKSILDWKSKQLIRIEWNKQDGEDMEDRFCSSDPLEDAGVFFPTIIIAGKNITIDHIISPGLLLGAMDWEKAQYKGVTEYRNITADRWDWCNVTQYDDIKGDQVSIQTYWAVPDWKFPCINEKKKSNPLGYRLVVYDGGEAITLMTHNVLYYMENDVLEEDFYIPAGLHCERLKESKKFPDFSKDFLFSFGTELVESGTKNVSWTENVYDFAKQFYKVNYDVRNGGKMLQRKTDVYDYPEKIVYSFYDEKIGTGCEINLINNTKTDISHIGLMQHFWGDKPEDFFGSDVTNYTYYGKSKSRRMQTDQWRGIRYDWPKDISLTLNPKTLWEWQFTNKNISFVTDIGDTEYLEKTVPVHLTITALEEIKTTSKIIIPKWTSFQYTLFDFIFDPDQSTSYIDFGVFDVYNCFSANWRRHLSFQLDLSDWPEVIQTPLFNLPSFKDYWTNLLAKTGKVSQTRITRLGVTSEAGGSLIEFVLLFRHPDIGNIDHGIYESMTPGNEAMKNIENEINSGNLKYKHTNGKEIVAVKGSLSIVTDQICDDVSTTSTESTSSSSSTNEPVSTTNKPPDEDNDHEYSGGDLAGVGIGMGITGIAIGAGMTFLIQIKQIHLICMSWFNK